MKLYLIRHGLTGWNLDKRLQGRADIPLSDQGREILRAARTPAGVAHLRLLSSPLVRAVESAEILFARKPEIEPRLVEMDWGEWEGGRIADLREELGEEMISRETLGLDFEPPGGESPRRVQARLAPLLAELGALGEDVAAVTHNGVIRAVMARAYDWDMLGRPPIKLDRHAAHCVRLDAAGRPTPERFNIPIYDE